MSEIEIQRRKEYKRNRKKWTLIQLVAIILFAAITLGCLWVYNEMNRTYYVEYTERGKVNYKIQYAENNFFDSEWIDKDQSYISSLIRGMTADFIYELNADSSDLEFKYEYTIDATLVVASKESGAPYYKVEENLLGQRSAFVKNGDPLQFSETVPIDFVKYNHIATSFVNAYSLKNAASCTLIVTLNVNVLSTNRQFGKENQNSYSVSLNVPLAVEDFNIHTTSSSPDSEVKVLEYQDTADREIFFVSGIISGSLTVLLLTVLLAFLHLTKNEDITYAAKIRKIMRSYGSYIQRTDEEFCCDGYQVIMIKTFTEMLGIRDTIQSPILASENKDETMTRFCIPTNTQVLYVFEIKVDNYDAIYGNAEWDETPVILEDVDQQELAEAMAEPDVDLSKIEYEPDDDDLYEVAPEEPGIEVIGVVWPEHEKKNKVYRYDPNGEVLDTGDVVLVSTRDTAKGVEKLRKVAVAHGNHRVDPEHIKHPLKKIIAVIRRRVSHSLTPTANEDAGMSDDNNNN